ncbi:MAG TPA: class I SAM-dependent methyltransferase [Thermoguttaceae bacterium]|nr:class I SAM-dependent methyltransferase [Thermoguttaceae bacterium]
MNRLPELSSAEVPDWDMTYRRGTPPWETGRPSGELVRVLQEGVVRPSRVLELGCGTGSDAIHLARCGFEVTAVDSSPIALERARARAEHEDVLARFVLGDVFEFAKTAGEFELVYEAGFYHFMRLVDLNRFLDLLWRATYPGSYYFALIGSTGETAESGPPQVSEDEVHDELGRLFEFVHMRPFRFESPRRKEGYLGWSCLMRRPVVGG